MYRSESIICNLLIEIDSLSNRVINIKKAYCNTAHDGLRKRLFNENKYISLRLNEIYTIATFLKGRNNEKINFASLLVELCERTIAQTKLEKDLFFL